MSHELAYLAGYFDGDGAVMLRPHPRATSSHYLLTVAVGSCDEAQCRQFEALFGGCVRQHKHGYRKKDGSLTVYYEWRATQQKAEPVLSTLRPYLRLKAEQAEIGLLYRMQVGRRGHVVTVEEQVERATLHGRMASLNARGKLVPLRRPGPGSAFTDEATELAYLAGFFDAEGTITWINDRGRQHPLLHVGVGNVIDTACWYFALRFGGQVNEIHRAGRGIFSWYRRQRHALAVLQVLAPYLREKRHAAEVALARGIRPSRRVVAAERKEA